MNNDMDSVSRKLFIRTFLPTTVMVLLLVVVNFSVILPAFERNMLASKKVAAEDMVAIALDEINFYYKEYVEGKKSLEMAQQRALDHLQTLRYGEKKNNYFWVLDLESNKMLMHSSMPSLNNKDLNEIVGPTGNKLYMVEFIKEQGSGYLDYLWYSFEDPNKVVTKLSYVDAFEEWGWGIGTGIYLDDVKEELAAMNKKIMQVIFSILSVVLAISVLLIIQAQRSQSALFATQKALGEKEAVLEATLESSPDGILVVYGDGRISHYNNKYLDIWNIPEESMNIELHNDLVEIVKEDVLENSDITNEILAKCNAAKGKTEDVLKTKDGRFIEVRTTPLLTRSDDSGRVWLFRDITDRKLAEENILSYIRFLESMDKIDHIIREGSGKELLPDILEELLDIFDCERSWIMRPSSLAMEEWDFYDMKFKSDYYADVLGKTFPMDEEMAICMQSTIQSKEPVVVGEDQILRVPTIAAVNYGVKSCLAIAIQPYSKSPWVLGLDNCNPERLWTESDITIFREISRRLEYSLNKILLTQNLKESENRLRTLINAMPDIVCFKDADGRWLEANDFDLKLFELEGVDYKNKKDSELALYSDFYREAFLACEDSDEIAWNARELSRSDEVIPAPDGRQLVFDVIKVPIFNEDGSRHGLVVVGRDITERKKSEKEKERLLHILSEKNEELASIVFIASHDLRSPLVNIVGFSNELLASLDELKVVLDKGVTSKETMEKVDAIIEDDILMSVNFINAGSKKMDKLLTGMLKLCRLGSEPLKIVKVDMNLMLNEILSTMQYQISQLEFSVKVGDLECCYGDLNKINQVFSNLIDNAIKYRDPSRKPTITVTSQKDDGLTTYCVEDNGKGIDASHVNKVFEVFHRLDPEENIKGEGLGLTIVKRIVNRLHGKIWVESVKGEGSKFFISLPNKPFDV